MYKLEAYTVQVLCKVLKSGEVEAALKAKDDEAEAALRAKDDEVSFLLVPLYYGTS